jgi:glutamine synthetase adenylyltransferase
MTTIQKKPRIGQVNPIAHLTNDDLELIAKELDDIRQSVIEKMGHLEREDADFLRDSATFYRAIDHGLRVWSGHAAGKLPSSQMQLEVLTELVHRWTPPHMSDQPLTAKLSQVRKRTREFFNRLFG